MAACENACSSISVPINSEPISVSTTTIPSFDDMKLDVKSCNTSSSFHNAANFSHWQPEVRCLSIIEDVKSPQAFDVNVNKNEVPTPSEMNDDQKSSSVLENELKQTDQDSTGIASVEVQHSAQTDGDSKNDNNIFNTSLFDNGDVDNSSLSELADSNLLGPIDNDENTTQLRFIPSISNENLPVANNTCQIVNNSNHLFLETTLLAQSQDEPHKNEFQEINYFLPASNYDNSDEESSISFSSETSEYPSITDSTSHLNELSASVATPEELSLDSGIASLHDTEQITKPPTENTENKQFTKLNSPPKSILGRKRRFCELSTTPTTEKSSNNSFKTKVAFNGVTVYYFPRKQSFVTVPSQGGSTLGMSLRHSHCKKMSLTQHKRVIARHRQKVLEEQQKQFQFDAKVKQLRQMYPDMELAQIMSLHSCESDAAQESSSDEEEEEEDDGDNDDSSSDDDLDDDNYFLQPIPAKKRRLLLRLAGVQKIEIDEKFSNKRTRKSREICGCDCDKVCLPSSCQCALAGIPCQVDRESFPCGCIATGCRNTSGRVEFDSERVKKHYVQTMRKIRLQETGVASREVEELPQPPKSPYVAALERDSDRYGEETTHDGESMQNIYAESNAQPIQSAYDQTLQISSNTLFNAPAATASWSSYLGNDRVVTPSAYANNDTHSNPGVHFENFSCCQEPTYFDSAAFSDVTSSFLTPEVNSMEYMMPPPTAGANPATLVNYDTTCKDFSFAEGHLAAGTVESKLSSVFGGGTQSDCRQTFKLDPITSFFPANGRRLSQETSFLFDLPESCSHAEELSYQSPIGSSSSCKQPCSIESLLCPEEQSRSRSSSLSECSHDSVVKA